MRTTTNSVLIICGPTATGKTRLGINLAKKFNGEIVSADSRQVYRGMNIGTGKELPTYSHAGNISCRVQYEKKIYLLRPYRVDGIAIWLYDVIEPDEEFNVAQYQKLGRGVIEDIHGRGKLPIVVGGTGFYIKALTECFGTLEIPPDPNLRKKLEQLNLDQLQEMLQSMNPVVWKKLNDSDRGNIRRLIRKIEVTFLHKDTLLTSPQKPYASYETRTVGLTGANEFLYSAIDVRVAKRVRAGVIGEIRQLLRKGYSWSLSSMRTMGYKEWKKYFETKNVNREQIKNDAVQQWKYHEHAYARRQMTWFRKQADIQWFNVSDRQYLRQVEETVRSWYTDC